MATATGARPRVVLAHDWLVGYRGGEAVLDALVRMCEGRYEIASIYAMFDDGRGVTPAIDRLPRTVSRLSRLPARMRRWLLPLYPLAVGELSRKLASDHARKPIDLVISTSSAAIKGLRTPEGVPHVCYCHSPARYLWSQTEQYALGPGGWLRSLGLRVFGGRLRDWDRCTAANVTTFIANSTHTAAEIERCYRREAVVVHPPVRTEFMVPPNAVGQRSGWLCVGALEPYKRMDLAVDAARRAGASLTIVGSGSMENALRTCPGRPMTITGRIDDDALRDRYQSASVLVFPQIEDFGIVAVEAQSCGLPVVAFRAGGALDSVVEGKTGVFFDEPTPEAIIAAVQRCLELGDVSRACRENAERFGEARFEREILAIVENALR